MCCCYTEVWAITMAAGTANTKVYVLPPKREVCLWLVFLAFGINFIFKLLVEKLQLWHLHERWGWKDVLLRWACVRETLSKSNSPRESTETPQRSTPSSLNTSTGTGSQSQSLRSVDGLKGEITTDVHCNVHIHTFIRQKITWLFLETHVPQKHSVLIVGSREIVLCGTDLRKLIIKSLQGSMC